MSRRSVLVLLSFNSCWPYIKACIVLNYAVEIFFCQTFRTISRQTSGDGFQFQYFDGKAFWHGFSLSLLAATMTIEATMDLMGKP